MLQILKCNLELNLSTFSNSICFRKPFHQFLSQIDELKSCIEEREEEMSRLRTATVSAVNHFFISLTSLCHFPHHQKSSYLIKDSSVEVPTKGRHYATLKYESEGI